MPTRAISRSRDLPKLACFLAGDTRDIATHVFVVGHAKIGRFYRHEIFAFASACMFHKVTFDWCLSQLVVAVRLWSWTTSYVGTEWGPQIWLCVPVRPSSNVRKHRRPSEARPPASDRKAVTNRTALVVQYCFNLATTSDVVHGSEVLKLDCVRKSVSPVHPEKKSSRTTIACTPWWPILICSTWI